MSPPLPSAEFLALVPENGSGLTCKRVEEVGKMLASGLWLWDAQEVDPRTGWNMVHALARSSLMDEEVRIAALSLVVSRGADVNFVAPDGLTAWQWASSQRERDLQGQLEKLGATVPEGVNTAARQEVLETLRSLGDSWMSAESIVKKIMEPSGFGSLDARSGGVPLGLQIAWTKLSINGAALAGTATGTEPGHVESLTDRLVEKLGRLGKAALLVDAHSDFPLWCWLAQAQALHWAPDESSKTRKSRWNSQWVSLEKAIIRSRYKRQDIPAAQRQLGQAATDLVGQVMEALPQSGIALQQKKLQPLAAYLLSSLRQWTDRSFDLAEGEDGQRVKRARLETLWQAHATLAETVPVHHWREEFSGNWASAAYYALRPDLRSALRSGADIPEFVQNPWLTLPGLIQSPDVEPTENMDLLLGWLAASPASPAQRELGLAMLAHHPEVASRLSARVLESTLIPATPVSPSPKVRL